MKRLVKICASDIMRFLWRAGKETSDTEQSGIGSAQGGIGEGADSRQESRADQQVGGEVEGVHLKLSPDVWPRRKNSTYYTASQTNRHPWFLATWH